VGVPALIVIVVFGASAVASARWLPRLAAGPVGHLAFAVVCGLIAATMALIGAEIYLTMRAIGNATAIGGLGAHKADLFASGVVDTLRGAGPLVGLAAAVYLLGPGPDDDVSSEDFSRD